MLNYETGIEIFSAECILKYSVLNYVSDMRHELCECVIALRGFSKERCEAMFWA